MLARLNKDYSEHFRRHNVYEVDEVSKDRKFVTIHKYVDDYHNRIQLDVPIMQVMLIYEAYDNEFDSSYIEIQKPRTKHFCEFQRLKSEYCDGRCLLCEKYLHN